MDIYSEVSPQKQRCDDAHIAAIRDDIYDMWRQRLLGHPVEFPSHCHVAQLFSSCSVESFDVTSDHRDVKIFSYCVCLASSSVAEQHDYLVKPMFPLACLNYLPDVRSAAGHESCYAHR